MKRLLYEEKSYRLLAPSYFKIYEDRIEAYFWPYRHITSISDIKKISVIEGIPWYVSWGLRVNPFIETLYFAIHRGRSIEIERENGYWKKIVLSVKNPEKFMSIINESRIR